MWILPHRCKWMYITCFLGSASGMEEGNMNELNLEIANRCDGAWPRAAGSDVGRHPIGYQQLWDVAFRCIYLGLHSPLVFF